MLVICPNCGEKVAVGGLGRKRLDMPVKIVCDTLRKRGSVTEAAKELGCSRAYIYKILKANGLKPMELIREQAR